MRLHREDLSPMLEALNARIGSTLWIELDPAKCDTEHFEGLVRLFGRCGLVGMMPMRGSKYSWLLTGGRGKPLWN
jgi:hypothetical protein